MPRFCVKLDTHRGALHSHFAWKKAVKTAHILNFTLTASSHASPALSPRSAYISPTFHRHDLAPSPFSSILTPYIQIDWEDSSFFFLSAARTGWGFETKKKRWRLIFQPPPFLLVHLIRYSGQNRNHHRYPFSETHIFSFLSGYETGQTALACSSAIPFDVFSETRRHPRQKPQSA